MTSAALAALLAAAQVMAPVPTLATSRADLLTGEAALLRAVGLLEPATFS